MVNPTPQTFNALQTEIDQIIVGQNPLIQQLFIALLSGGHVILEGVPGVGKTLLVKFSPNSSRQTFAVYN
jgi:MoxR-like ATPase